MKDGKYNYDIEYLKLKLRYYEELEEYEKAITIKRWIIELGGDPKLEIKNDKDIKKN